MADRQLSNEEVVSLMNAKIQETGIDSFRIRINRRPKPPAIAPESVGLVGGATAIHVAQPESWLPAVLGGGQYILSVFHESAPTILVGAVQWTIRAEPKEVFDPLPMNMDGWNGPTSVIGGNPPYAGGVFTPPQGSRHHPQTTDVRGVDDRSSRGADISLIRDVDRLTSKFEQMEKDAARREHDMAQMFMTLRQDLGRRPEAPAKPSFSPEFIVAAAPIATALITHLMSSGERQAARAEAQALEHQKFMAQMITTMKERPGIDPALEKVLSEQRKLIERMTERGEPDQIEVMTQMAGVTSQMLGMAVKATAAVAEANMGKGESSFMPAFREAMSAIQGIFMATQAQKQAKARQAQQQLPAHPAPQAQPQAQQQPQPVVQVVPDQPEPPVVDQLVEAIKGHRDYKEVAAVLVNLAKNEDPEFIAAVEEAGNLNELFAQRLGIWAMQPDNLAYTRSLLEETMKLGTEAGVFAPQPAEEEEGDEEYEDEVAVQPPPPQEVTTQPTASA